MSSRELPRRAHLVDHDPLVQHGEAPFCTALRATLVQKPNDDHAATLGNDDQLKRHSRTVAQATVCAPEPSRRMPSAEIG